MKLEVDVNLTKVNYSVEIGTVSYVVDVHWHQWSILCSFDLVEPDTGSRRLGPTPIMAS